MAIITKVEIMEGLTGVFRDVFDDPALVPREEMTAADVATWDSLTHIDLIVAVEHKFRVKFTTREVAGLKNVGELAEITSRKLAAKP